jgi:phage terminase Nu1 subunit (DNA packaging protein)
MTQATAQERATARRRNGADHAAVLVSGYALARHFGITRQAVDALANQGVIERRATDAKFDQDASRLRYFADLRAEHRRSPRTQADADHVRVKTEMVHLKLMEKRRELVRRDDCDALIDSIAGVVLTALSGMPARCSRDPVVRRNIELVVHEVRREMAQVCEVIADKNGEPPLDGQD